MQEDKVFFKKSKTYFNPSRALPMPNCFGKYECNELYRLKDGLKQEYNLMQTNA